VRERSVRDRSQPVAAATLTELAGVVTNVFRRGRAEERSAVFRANKTRRARASRVRGAILRSATNEITNEMESTPAI
jgi:hypothetical protein